MYFSLFEVFDAKNTLTSRILQNLGAVWYIYHIHKKGQIGM